MADPKQLQNALAELLIESVDALLQRVRSGELETKDFAVVFKVLKDNGMTLDALMLLAPAPERPQMVVPFGDRDAMKEAQVA